jgi:hypothetical protein
VSEVESDFQQRLLEELLLFLDPVLQAGRDPGVALELIRLTGWSPEALLGSNATAYLEAVGAAAGAVIALSEALSQPPENLDQFVSALQKTADTIKQIDAISQPLGGENRPELATFAKDLMETLGLLYLQRRSDFVIAMLRLLKIIDMESVGEVVYEGRLARYAGDRPRLMLDRLTEVLADPVAYLKLRYEFTGASTSAELAVVMEQLMLPLARLLQMTGAEAIAGRGSSPPQLSPDREARFRRTLVARWFAPFDEPEAHMGFALQPLAADENGPGLVLVPFGHASLSAVLGEWQLNGSLSGTPQGLLVRQQGVDIIAEGGTVIESVTLGLHAEKIAPEDVAFRIGSRTGTHLQIGQFSVSVRGVFSRDRLDYGAQLDVASSAIIVQAGDFDNFLQKVLPKDGFRTDFDLAVGWSNRKGLYFHGSAGLEATLPIHKSILGVLTLESIYLALRTQEIESGAQDPAIETVAAATAKVELGPFRASVERIGLLATFTFPSTGGNLGPANVGLDFKLPDGAGMTIDGEAIVGGGYLSFDSKNEQYAGILQLEVKGGIALKAIGLLTTRMPDGSKGFSLLVIITAEFPPIQLGYGFTLSGVGGLLGVHRTMVIDVLRAGIKNRTLDSILFPQNPVDNATKIISDLRGVFPVASGRFVFGPMAILGWGVPTILTLELGILIELPAPVRVALLGTLTMILPEEKAPAVVVHMDVLGVLDFDKGEVSIDATLYDSRIAIFALTGDMALRANWGASPTFALSAGGFNPRFPAPPAFPALDRLALTLATGDNPRLRLEAYLALTANTAQLGARVDLYAEAPVELLGFEKTLSVEAYLGFDTLIQFSPFGLIADIGALATVRLDGEQLVPVTVNLALTGPQPWHAWGEATVEALGMKWQVPFDVTVGPAAPAELPPPPDPLERLRAALADRRNWSGQLPGDRHMLVTLRQLEVGQSEILVHPLGDLTVRQREAPLEVEIAKFGALPLPARQRYAIDKVEVGSASVTPKTNQQVRDAFAPGQFFDMSDDEKLSRPAFESLPAGYTRLGVGGTTYASDATRTAVFHYDTVIIDKQDEVARQDTGEYFMAPGVVPVLAGLGAAAESPMRRTSSARFAGPSQNVVVNKPAYAIASPDDLAVVTPAMSYVEAEEAQRGLGGDGAGWQVVGAHEVEG